MVGATLPQRASAAQAVTPARSRPILSSSQRSNKRHHQGCFLGFAPRHPCLLQASKTMARPVRPNFIKVIASNTPAVSEIDQLNGRYSPLRAAWCSGGRAFFDRCILTFLFSLTVEQASSVPPPHGRPWRESVPNFIGTTS